MARDTVLDRNCTVPVAVIYPLVSGKAECRLKDAIFQMKFRE